MLKRLTTKALLIFLLAGASSLANAAEVSFFELKSGAGFFRDLQLPRWDLISEDINVRADGSTVSKDNGNHFGFPVEASYTYRYSEKLWSVDASARMTLIKHVLGDEETSAASFQRINLSARPSYKGRYLGIPYRVGGYISLNRNDYLNVSSGHTLTSLLAGPMLEAGSLKNLRVEGTYLYSLNPTFSYRNSGEYFNLKSLEGSASSHQIIKLEGSRYLGRKLIGVASYELDYAAVNVKDVGEYVNFGLVVDPYQEPERDYELETHIITIGVRKIF